MSAFPSMWQLILPNWNVMTLIGILVIILGIIGLKIAFTDNIKKVSIIAILSGIILIWGFSVAQDIINSTLGSIIFWMIIAVSIFGFILFYEPKKPKRRKKR